MKKGIIQNCQLYGHKAFISQLEVSEINSSVVDDRFRLPLTSTADPYLLCSKTKQKSGVISAQLQKFRIFQKTKW